MLKQAFQIDKSPADPPEPVPGWCIGARGPKSAAARLNDVTEVQIDRWVAAGRVRVEWRGRNRLVALDDIARLAAAARDLDLPAPLTQRLADRRRRRAAAPELPLRPDDGDGAGEGAR
jgi:hypothetical protein